MTEKSWQFWIDRGGTFTDIVAILPNGEVKTHKLLSENPDHYSDAATEGIRYLQSCYASHPNSISSLKMGTTVATNALLERKGEPTALLTSKGLRDQLLIGYQTRPDIFAIDIPPRQPLYDAVVEAPERILESGQVELSLDKEGVTVQLQDLYDQGFRSLAVVFMHAYKYPEHEAMVGSIASRIGFDQISLSHQVSPLIKYVPRGDTTVADAYLSPVLRRYVARVCDTLDEYRPKSIEDDSASILSVLEFMQSNGGLAPADQFQGKDAILSGPAGGVVGMVKTAEADGFDQLLGFDMGGTSTDVSHYAGELERETETIIAGSRLRVPMMNIHTVAAGGGSIVRFADGRLQVGPDSAGAYPGPACYRNGGPLTVTDCNVVLGRIQPDYFPHIFGKDQKQPIDVDGVRKQFDKLASDIETETGIQYTIEQLALGFLTVAIESMSAAVKKISVQRGYDIANYTLCAFGGAGAQHACAVAECLGVNHIYLHPMAGILSAYGIGIADQRWLGEMAVEQPLDSSLNAIQNIRESLLQQHAKQHSDRNQNRQRGFVSGDHFDVTLNDVKSNDVKFHIDDTSIENTKIDSATIDGTAIDGTAIDGTAIDGTAIDGTRDIRTRLYLRYSGSDTPLLINSVQSLDSLFHQDKVVQESEVSITKSVQIVDELKTVFEDEHRTLFGFISPERSILVDAIQVEIITQGQDLPIQSTHANFNNTATSDKQVKVYSRGDTLCETGVVRYEQLDEGIDYHGPLLIIDQHSTIWVENHWTAKRLASGAISLTHKSINELDAQDDPEFCAPDEEKQSDYIACDPIKLEIFNHLFMSVAEQMGFILEKTASSVNIKERLDFSCAVFDKNGSLVANAPHIPVHLGSMSESIQAVINKHSDMSSTDAFVLNTPYDGGTHLPDITVVKPVFVDKAATKPDFFVAARGHHADIGGITPGSMPANSSHIDEEGILIDNIVLVKNGEFQFNSLRSLLGSGQYPSRNINQNIADLQAQLAACERGTQELIRLSREYGTNVVHLYMQFVQDNAEQTLKQCLKSLPSAGYKLKADDGTQFQVEIRVDQQAQRALVDFTGTAYRDDHPTHPGNFNAPTSVVKAAVLYCFRLLVNKSIPLNAGFMRALDINIPDNSIISPQYPAAVVSGNVETAQCLVNCLLGALRLVANGQGTNNNFTFGNAQFQYYETLCGGSGATENAHGTDAVHTHMTNSRLTDPEILEQRYPVVLDHFHIRHNSGGRGYFDGGDGVERHIRFLMDMRANIISGQRKQNPRGLEGGGDGRTGLNFVKCRDGKVQWLNSCENIELRTGDTFCIHTPGGGAYGEPHDD